MYFRNRIPSQDDQTIMNIALQNFEVSEQVFRNVLNNAHEVLMVCLDDGTVAGFVSYRFRVYDMVLVDYVVLDAKYQRQGIARSLLPVFENHLIQRGIRRVFGMVHNENHEAIASFKRMGFQVRAGIAHTLIIEKLLPQTANAPSMNRTVQTPGANTGNPVNTGASMGENTQTAYGNYVRRLTPPTPLGRMPR